MNAQILSIWPTFSTFTVQDGSPQNGAPQRVGLPTSTKAIKTISYKHALRPTQWRQATIKTLFHCDPPMCQVDNLS